MARKKSKQHKKAKLRARKGYPSKKIRSYPHSQNVKPSVSGVCSTHKNDERAIPVVKLSTKMKPPKHVAASRVVCKHISKHGSDISGSKLEVISCNDNDEKMGEILATKSLVDSHVQEDDQTEARWATVNQLYENVIFKERLKMCWTHKGPPVKDEKYEVMQIPFNCVFLKDFIFDPNFLSGVIAELESLQIKVKNNDLYQFKQSDDLKSVTSPYISSLCSFFCGPLRKWMMDVTGIELNYTVDISFSVYEHTDVLLCHDDGLEGRRIAYILYLVPSWEEKDGGSLDLFRVDGDNCPLTVVKHLYPEFNSLAFFEVSPASFHQVSEVLTESKKRMSINGWFNGPPLTRPPKCSEQPWTYISPGNIPEQLLNAWINPVFLHPNCQEEIRCRFEVNSEIQLNSFIKENKYEELSSALQNLQTGWCWMGPPDRRHYEVVNQKNAPDPVREFIALMRSEAVFLILSQLTGLNLHPLAHFDQTTTSDDSHSLSDSDMSSESVGPPIYEDKETDISEESKDVKSDDSPSLLYSDVSFESADPFIYEDTEVFSVSDDISSESVDSSTDGGKQIVIGRILEDSEDVQNDDSHSHSASDVCSESVDPSIYKDKETVSGNISEDNEDVHNDDRHSLSYSDVSSESVDPSIYKDKETVSGGEAVKPAKTSGKQRKGESGTAVVTSVSMIKNLDVQETHSNLNGLCEDWISHENEEPESQHTTEERAMARVLTQIRRWKWGSYTLIRDDDAAAGGDFVLDAMFFCHCSPDWAVKHGGTTSYLARDEDKELLTVVPHPNSLALVYRDKKTIRFTKYINSSSRILGPMAVFHEIHCDYKEG